MRYRLLDTLRGFSLVSMILYHICWDLVHMYGFDWFGAHVRVRLALVHENPGISLATEHLLAVYFCQRVLPGTETG